MNFIASAETEDQQVKQAKGYFHEQEGPVSEYA